MRRYDNYDYEMAYKECLEKAADSDIENMIKNRCVKFAYRTKTVKSGEQLDAEIYPSFYRPQDIPRTKLYKVKQKQKNLNEKNSRKNLIWLINENFKNKDLWVTLNYDPEHLPENIEAAQNDVRNFIRRYNRLRKKRGMENAKYIIVTEYEEGELRFHHHIVLSGGVSMDEVEDLWGKGKRNHIRRMERDDRGFIGIGTYITKIPNNSKHKKKYIPSKGLKKPDTSKSYTKFRKKEIDTMTCNRNTVQGMAEEKYPGYKYVSQEIRYNPNSNLPYVQIHMRVMYKEELKSKICELRDRIKEKDTYQRRKCLHETEKALLKGYGEREY